MISGLEIRVLGDLQVLRDGVALDLPPSRKTRALLAYLAVMGKAQRRERLCEMFWEVPDDPRGALRWSLSKIRGLLNDGEGDRLAADRNVVALDLAAIRTDFGAVKSQSSAGLDGLDVAALKGIADAFRGQFLDDLSLPRCPEFEAWRTAHANDLELLRLDVLRRLIDRLKGDPEAALPYAHQLQRLVPDDPGLPRLVAGLAEAARRTSVGRAGIAIGEAAETPEAGLPPSAEPQTRQPRRAPEIRFCTARDGARLAYSMVGSGPAIVRAAHWMSHLQYDVESPVWRHWIRELSATATLLRYDERGNGMSDWDVPDVSFEAMVGDLESVVDASGFRKVVLLGISQSCATSVAYAVRHPERVHGLILYGGYVKGWRARGNPSEIILREAMNTLMRLGWGRDDPIFRQLFTALFIPGASKEQMDWMNDLQRKTVTPENAYRLAESFGEIDVSGLLPRVAVPTLVIHARGDRVAPIESGREYATGIRGARFVELEGENHILLEGEPAFDAFIDHVRRFVAEVTAPRPAASGGTKRPLSVLVADIESEADPFADMDPEIAETALEPLEALVASAVGEHGGHIVEMRDGMVTAAFGADRAVEEHAVMACRAARAIRDAIARSGAGARVRIAIESGEAVVRGAVPAPGGRVDLSGPVLKAAARVAGVLQRDIVVLTARARESAGGFVSATRLSRAEIPGLSRDEVVYELLGENRALSRWYLRARQGLTPLVGRGVELEALSQAWLAAREGTGRVVGVVGSPGVGKSRVTHEFVGSEELRGFGLVEAGAQEIDEPVAYAVAKRLVLSLFGLDEGNDDAGVQAAVRRRLDEAGPDAALAGPVLDLLDQPVTDPEWRAIQGPERARRIREAVTALVRREAERRPLAVLVEDLHWADRESRLVLEELVRSIADRRILLILTYRPGFAPPWAGADEAVELRLSPLDEAECRQLVQAILGDDPSLEDLPGVICRRADGVPLFVEEIVSALVQSRRLAGRPGTMRAVAATARVDIPATVQSVIAARVDKLDPADRAVVEIASVIGMVAPRALVAALAGSGEGFAASVERVLAGELMFETSAGADRELHFKHALIQEATYASLTADRRRALHASVLAALEDQQPARFGLEVERLAHHAVRAEAWDKAAPHLIAAADRAVERSAFPAAAGFLEQAASALDRLPQTADTQGLAIDVRMRMRIAYMVMGDFEKAVARLEEAQAVARRMGDPDRLAYTLLHTSYVYSTFGRVPPALAVAEEARAIGLMTGDERQIAEADLAAAQAHMIRGEAAPSLRRLTPHIGSFLERWGDDRLGFLITRSVWFTGSLASTRALLGEHDAAEADIADTVRLAAASGRPIDAYATMYFESLVRLVHGPDPAFLARLAAAAAECRERAPFPFHPWLLATLGHARLTVGERVEATRTLEAALAAAEQANMPHFVTYTAALLAVAAARPGDPASMDDLADALRTAREGFDRWTEVEVLQALADLEQGAGRRRHLETALLVAREAGYRPFEARLARRLAALGEGAAA